MLTRKITPTEIEEFGKKFPAEKNWSYSVASNNAGQITGVETKHKEILDYCKKLGLVVDKTPNAVI